LVTVLITAEYFSVLIKLVLKNCNSLLQNRG
jgi:hypothetical protein